MGAESGLKRYEPYGFILYLAMVSMTMVMGYGIYKYIVNLHAGTVIKPVFLPIHYLGIGVSALALVLLLFSRYLVNRQKFDSFRAVFSLSFYLSLFFLVLQVGNVPRSTFATQDSGNYFLGFLMSVHSLFLAIALVGQGVILARLSKRISYVDSFIFNVNPPNILNFRLLLKYMVFMFVLWLLVCLFLISYAA